MTKDSSKHLNKLQDKLQDHSINSSELNPSEPCPAMLALNEVIDSLDKKLPECGCQKVIQERIEQKLDNKLGLTIQQMIDLTSDW